MKRSRNRRGMVIEGKTISRFETKSLNFLNMTKYTVVTQSFGRENEYRRAIFAILSFYAVADNSTPTILFTDKPEYFKDFFQGLPVSYILLTPKKIKLMRGKIDFLHRMKIALIEEAMQVSGTSIMYIDSDTYFLNNPERYMQQVSPTQGYMLTHEYNFEEVRYMPLPAGKTVRAFINYIDETEVYIPGTDVRVSTKMSSWNAGAILLHQSNLPLIDKVYKLTDLFFPACNSHASEQYAFSIVLGALANVKPIDNVIYHYWYRIKKRVMDEYLEMKLDTIKLTDTPTRISFITKSISLLPHLFESHIYTLKDNAIQSFNEKKFDLGLRWTLKAFLNGGLNDKKFARDFLYHTRVKLLGK